MRAHAETLVDDQETDRRVVDQVERLRSASTVTALEVLRREVATVSELLTALMADRCLSVARDDQQFSITASIGLAELRRGEAADDWLERADQALYQAKSNGRDQRVIAP